MVWGCIVEWGRERALQNSVDRGWELLFLGDLGPAFVIEVCLSPVRFGKPFLLTSSTELGPKNAGLGWAECLEPGPKVTHSEEKRARPTS